MKDIGHRAKQIVFNHTWSVYRKILFWYWITFILIFLAIGFMQQMNIFSNTDLGTAGVWNGAVSIPGYFLFVIGILLTPISLANFVTSGITRKHFTIGTFYLLLIMSAISAIVLTAGFPVEHLLYHLFTSSGNTSQPSLLRFFIEHFLLFVGYFSSGWMIGTIFSRFQWHVGILYTVIAFSPTILMEYMIKQEWNTLASIGELILIAALMLAVNFKLLARIPIKRRSMG